MTRTTFLAALSLMLTLAGCYGVPVAPPPAAASQSGGSAPAGTLLGATCYAGAYVCAMPVAGAVGSGCACPGLGAPSYGVIR